MVGFIQIKISKIQPKQISLHLTVGNGFAKFPCDRLTYCVRLRLMRIFAKYATFNAIAVINIIAPTKN